MPTMWPRRSWACLLAGMWAVRYISGTEGDGLRISSGPATDDRGLNDIGELTGAVRYDGQTLSLNPAELTYQEIA